MIKKTLIFIFTMLLASQAIASEDYTITAKGKVFVPSTLQVPINQKIRLIVKNETDAPIEFESFELGREKVIQAGGQAIIFISPLKSGNYKYFNEFNTAMIGTINAK